MECHNYYTNSVCFEHKLNSYDISHGYIPLLGGCYGKSCKLNGQHTRARNHSAISRVVIALHKLLHRGPGLMIFIMALSKRNRI